MSFAGGLRNARQEGRYDVLLVRAHPDAAGRLAARGARAAAADDARERLLRDLAAPVPDGAWIAAARAAERTRAYATWMRIVMRAQRAAYLAGVADGHRDGGQRSTTRSRACARVPMSCAWTHARATRRCTCRAATSAASSSACARTAAATAAATTPGETWDAEAVLAARRRRARDTAARRPATLELVRA